MIPFLSEKYFQGERDVFVNKYYVSYDFPSKLVGLAEKREREIDDQGGIDGEGNSNKYEALVARIELPVVFVSASTATMIHQR